MHIRPASRNEPSSAPPDSAGAAALELAYEIACYQRLLRAGLTGRLRGWGISDHDFWVLWLCGRAAPNGVVQQELAAAVGVSTAQMSGLVERLRQHGLLASCRSDRDRRRQYWRLTAAGDALLAEIQTEIGERAGDWEAACSVQDRRAFLAVVRRLANVIAGPAGASDTVRGASDSAAVRGSCDGAHRLTESPQESGRPAAGVFGEVGRPAPNAGSTFASLSHAEAADERAHRRAS
jgi:DNA-binding MarR family transcriptional regulator